MSTVISRKAVRKELLPVEWIEFNKNTPTKDLIEWALSLGVFIDIEPKNTRYQYFITYPCLDLVLSNNEYPPELLSNAGYLTDGDILVINSSLKGMRILTKEKFEKMYSIIDDNSNVFEDAVGPQLTQEQAQQAIALLDGVKGRGSLIR